MDLADQTLVEDLSRGADTSVIQEVAVSAVFLLLGSPSSVLGSVWLGVRRCASALRSLFFSPLLLPRSLTDQVWSCAHSDLSFVPSC